MSNHINKRQNLLKACVRELEYCVETVQQYGTNKNQQLDILKEIAKEYSELDIQNSRAQEARQATDKHFDNQENDCTQDVSKIYNRYLEEQTSNSNSYKNHPIWCKINNIIEGKKPTDSNVNNEECDPDDDVNNSNDIEEGIIPTQFEPPIDPLTKIVIKDPCKNKKCGHVYEFSIIMEYLNAKKNKKQNCPYIGCTNKSLKSSSIVKDSNLKARIQEYMADNENNRDQSNSPNNINVI